jgi:hypothetical protein
VVVVPTSVVVVVGATVVVVVDVVAVSPRSLSAWAQVKTTPELGFFANQENSMANE